MRILIKNINLNVAAALRKCGYHFERRDDERGEISAVRNPGAGSYPRFHVYVKSVSKMGLEASKTERALHINLHLDQKKPSYKGSAAHSGEYEGPLVEQEGQRIKNILESYTHN